MYVVAAEMSTATTQYTVRVLTTSSSYKHKHQSQYTDSICT